MIIVTIIVICGVLIFIGSLPGVFTIILAEDGSKREIKKNREFLNFKSQILKANTIQQLYLLFEELKNYEFDLKKYKNPLIRNIINIKLIVVLSELIVKKMKKINSNLEQDLY